jgi:hypothetical protein
MTTPIQYLVFENVSASDQRGRSPHILYDLKQLLYNAKESFLDPRATRVLIDYPRRLLENVFLHLYEHFYTYLNCNH